MGPTRPAFLGAPVLQRAHRHAKILRRLAWVQHYGSFDDGFGRRFGPACSHQFRAHRTRRRTRLGRIEQAHLARIVHRLLGSLSGRFLLFVLSQRPLPAIYSGGDTARRAPRLPAQAEPALQALGELAGEFERSCRAFACLEHHLVAGTDIPALAHRHGGDIAPALQHRGLAGEQLAHLSHFPGAFVGQFLHPIAGHVAVSPTMFVGAFLPGALKFGPVQTLARAVAEIELAVLAAQPKAVRLQELGPLNESFLNTLHGRKKPRFTSGNAIQFLIKQCVGACPHLLANAVVAKPDIVSMPRGNIAIIGASEHTDGALLAALRTWQGAVVFIDARGLSSGLSRHNVVRFAPGRGDSASYSPLLAIRAGDHAWEDARRLASAFLQLSDQGLVDVFALLMLDQLLAAPIEQRTFAALRCRLADPQRVLTELCGARGADPLACNQPLSEMARISHICSAHPHATLAALARIDAALGLFADGAYANAANAHQFRFADLVAGNGPRTLVIAPPPGEAARGAPLIAAMLAQLSRECAPSADLDHLGWRKQRELLIVIEAEACRALGAARAGAQGAPPLVPAHASMNGCHALLQARNIDEAARLAHGGPDPFDVIAAIGPQSEASAAALSGSGGATRCWRRVKQRRETWKELVLPKWEQASRTIVSESELRNAPAERAYLFMRRLRPIRALALSVGTSAAHFADANALPQVAHDWSAPPLPRSLTPTVEANSLTASAKPIGAQIRKALTRKPPQPIPGAKTS